VGASRTHARTVVVVVVRSAAGWITRLQLSVIKAMTTGASSYGGQITNATCFLLFADLCTAADLGNMTCFGEGTDVSCKLATGVPARRADFNRRGRIISTIIRRPYFR